MEENKVLVTGSTGDFSVNVDIDSLGTAHAKLNKLISEIEFILRYADQAGQNAIIATGGEATRVGQAVQESLVTLNANEFARVKERVRNISDGVRILESAYTQEEEELVKAVNNYKQGYEGYNLHEQ